MDFTWPGDRITCSDEFNPKMQTIFNMRMASVFIYADNVMGA